MTSPEVLAAVEQAGRDLAKTWPPLDQATAARMSALLSLPVAVPPAATGPHDEQVAS